MENGLEGTTARDQLNVLRLLVPWENSSRKHSPITSENLKYRPVEKDIQRELFATRNVNQCLPLARLPVTSVGGVKGETSSLLVECQHHRFTSRLEEREGERCGIRRSKIEVNGESGAVGATDMEAFLSDLCGSNLLSAARCKGLKLWDRTLP
ncbi:hypothetical protein HG530_008377 [Fusarium avenaceum]|nr:hypothetical protein HG530_008377 [Fusarium avenaceum]